VTQSARINEYRLAVVSAFKLVLPRLGECVEQFGRFDLEALGTTMVKAPSVRVAVMDAKLSSTPKGEADAGLSCTAFIVTDGKQRDQEGWAIAEAIGVQLHEGQRFGLGWIGGPSNVSILPIVSGQLKNKAVALTAVSWRQTLRRLGEGIFDDIGQLRPELYINGEPTDG
jgi:hypothetical protein